MSEQVVARLEAVAARLERVASKMGGGGGGDDDDDAPMWVGDYENIVNTEVKAVVDSCKKIGIEQCGDILMAGYQNTLSLIKRAPNSKKPTNQEIQAFLKPAIEAIGKADNMKYKGKNFKKFGDHYKAMYETTMVISWVTMAPPMGLPAQHIEGQVQSTDFNLNRVLKNSKTDDTKEFIKNLKALNKKVQGYVKEYFKSSGLIYNPKGGSIADASEAGGSTATKSESKEAESKQAEAKKKSGGKKGKGKGGGGGMDSVFASLSKGTGITKGMKKVTKDMKTKNRKDRAGKVTVKAKGPKRRKKFGPPQTKFMGGRWMVENYETEAGVLEVDKANLKSNVFITMCDGCTVVIKAKVKAVTIDNCVKVRVFVSEVVSTVEVVNCKSVSVIVQDGGKVPSFAIDKCESPQIILSRSAFEACPDIYSSNVSAMNVEVPGKTQNDDNKEFPVPEQFITKIDPKSYQCITKATEH